jgi:hypothetical protein
MKSTNQISNAKAFDPDLKSLYKTGGVAGWITFGDLAYPGWPKTLDCGTS